MEEKEKLSVDIFIKYSTENLTDFQQALFKAKMVMMREIHMDKRFNPQKYARFYFTFRVLKLSDKKPVNPFNIFQQKIERLHNAAMSIEMLEFQISSLKKEEEPLFFYIEVGGIYAVNLEDKADNDVLENKDNNNKADTKPWYDIKPA